MDYTPTKGLSLSGRYFSPKELRQFLETAKSFSQLPRSELAYTLCEHFKWKNTVGDLKFQSCLTALRTLEKKKLLNLPATEKRAPRAKKVIKHTTATAAPKAGGGDIQLKNVELHLARTVDDRSLWNEYVSRYHSLGYSQPFGSALRYFAIDRASGIKLACILFCGASACALKDRDDWIGWSDEARTRNRQRILNNSRFLILPWASKQNLASKILFLSKQVIQKDWFQVYKQTPILIETFVDTETHLGTCYKASNWIQVGKTKGRGRNSITSIKSRSIKEIYLLPLIENCNEILCGGKIKNDLEILPSKRTLSEYNTDCKFAEIWKSSSTIIQSITKAHDLKWVVRARVLTTMIVVLMIMRLVFSKNSQGYKTTIDELWDGLRRQKIPLPREKPVTASAFCQARQKMPESIFFDLNNKIIDSYESDNDQNKYKFLDHRVFGVDGSKVALPKPLENEGYPIHKSYYPTGLVSSIYQLKSKIPYDFGLYPHHDERKAARSHLTHLRESDLVVYDRGYYSFHMLHTHYSKKIEAVFRLTSNLKVVTEFLKADENDIITSVEMGWDAQKIMKKHPEIMENKKLPIRLIKYKVEETVFCLGTTLLDQKKYPPEKFSDLYLSRWGIEELYKTCKTHIEADDFHGRTERGVKQELYASFFLITLARTLTNTIDEKKHFEKTGSTTLPWKSNIKNSLATLLRNIESLFQNSKRIVGSLLIDFQDSLSNCGQKIRPGRKFARQSKRARNKWDNYSKKKGTLKNLVPAIQ